MYTQIILLLFALHSLSAYSIVQIELKNGKEVSDVKELSNNTLEFISDQSKLPTLRQIIFVVDKYLKNNEDKNNTIEKKPPQEIPIELDESIRAFTNGHGFQFVDWKLVDEHQSLAADKAQDKTDNDNDRDSSDADNGDDTIDDETDKHDNNHVVPDIPEIDQRHLGIDKAKTSRNKMFDKMKEKYQSKKRYNVDPTEEARRKRHLNYQNIPGGNQYNIDPTAITDYKNRMFVNRAPFDNSKNVMSPVLRDERGNILYDNINTVYSGGRQFDNTPRAYGMNLNNDQGYPLNYVNNMPNEPMHNYYINQPIQQRSIESHTVNNNPYKQANTPEVVGTHVQQLPKSEINDIYNIQKFNQVPNHETLNRVPKEVENINTPQVIEIEKASNNGEVNTLKHNKEMLHNVNLLSKKIGSIKEKVKDRFANILNTPEGRKLLTQYGMTKTGHKGQTTNDIAAPNVQVSYLPPHSSNLITDNSIEVNPNSTIAINNIEDINVIESNRTNDRNDTTNSFVEVAENIDTKIKEQVEKPEKNTTVNSNTVNDTAAPNLQVLPPHSTIHTTDDNIEVNPNSTIAINNIEDMNVIEINRTNERNDTTNSLVEVAENIDIKIKEQVENPEKNTTVNSNTVNKNNTEPTTNQTIVPNKCENPEVPGTETLTTTCNETVIIEKDNDKESASDPRKIKHLNGTASTEVKEKTCTELEELIGEIKTETVAYETSVENCNSEEKCDADDSKIDTVSGNVNYDDLFNTDKFWDWLSQWTTAYMEILKENVEVIVKEEVAKQLEEIFSKAGKEMGNHSEKSNAQEELETVR